MIRSLLLLTLSLSIAFHAFAPCLCHADVPMNQLTEAEKRSGWTLIFDGKTTNGWRNYQRQDISDGWTVADGVLSRTGRAAGDIVTSEQYDNFELSIEYRISEGGNSGIMFHVSEDQPNPWQTGPEIQIQDDAVGDDPQKSGWLHQLYKPVKPDWAIQTEKQVGFKGVEMDDATRAAGQWNHVYLRIAPQQCEVAINGVHYYYFVKGDSQWDERVSKSKFSPYPRFGKNKKGHICLQDHGHVVAFRNIKIRRLAADGSVPEPIDGRLDLTEAVAFPQLQWEGWDGLTEDGRQNPIRPIVLTHGGDDTDRIFLATQGGVIHVFPNDPESKSTKRFLDISANVHPWQVDDEEGLLGLAFHPNYKENGQFFVYYSSKAEPRTSIVSRFRVSEDDPNKADPASEQLIMKIPQPFANHNGGSIAFGKDGYLYIGLGDGGGRNDPMANGQNLKTWMGSILRIDIDRKEGGRGYAIPEDNPFVDRKDAMPEIFAYGFRNVWRLSFDAETGTLFAADVGQDRWEEINIVRPGGNYGWSIREATHPFGNASPSTVDKPIDPIWEYDHQIGKSITGGYVYRGSRLPEIFGCYLYADYVHGKIWALKYDEQAGKVISNFGIRTTGMPIIAFGEDATGEIYFMRQSVSGKDIYRLVRGK